MHFEFSSSTWKYILLNIEFLEDPRPHYLKVMYMYLKRVNSLSFPRQVYNFLKLRYALYNLTNRL